MNILPSSAMWPQPSAPVTAKPASASEADLSAATSPRGDAERPPVSPFSVSRLAALLNMAKPGKPGLGDGLVSPSLILALQTPPPGPGGSGSTTIDITPPGGTKAVPIDLSPEGLAREMIDQLGDGEGISLEDAQAALRTPANAVIRNDPGNVSKYFAKLDRDGSGLLDHQELTALLRHRQQSEQNKPTDVPRRLPSTWA